MSVGRTLTLAGLLTASSGAAAQCQLPPTFGATHAWAQGTQVRVYMDPRYFNPAAPNLLVTPEAAQAMQTAVRTGAGWWAGAGGSQVSFDFQFNYAFSQNPPTGGLGIRMFDGSGPVPPGHNHGWTISRPGSTSLERATITFFSASDVTAGIMSHEMGHTFGLQNCSTCGNSVMNPTSVHGPPTPCDTHAARMNAGYTGPVSGGGGGGGGGSGPGVPPGGCVNCTIVECVRTRIGTQTGSGAWEWGPVVETCDSRAGCCRDTGGAGAGTSSWLGCGNWIAADACAFGGACCFQPYVPVIDLAEHGVFPADQQAACNATCAGLCSPARVSKTWTASGLVANEVDGWRCATTCAPTTPTFSLSATVVSTGETVTFTANGAQVVNPPAPLWDLGNGAHLAGGQVSYAYPAPGTYVVTLTATESQCGTTQMSTPVTVQVVPCVSSGCTAGACGQQTDNCGQAIWCGQCCTSSGCPSGACGLFTDNCGQALWCGSCGCSDACAGGACGWQTNSCGAQVYCGACSGCQSTGCPAGECGWQVDNCGAPVWCGSCTGCSSPAQPDPDLPPCP